MSMPSPSSRRARRFSRVGSWSLDTDTHTVRRSRDLRYWRSGADVAAGAVGAVARGVEFEIEETAVGFAVERHSIGFIDSEDIRNVFGWSGSRAAKHQTDVVQLHLAVAQVLPDPEADVSARGRQKRVLEFSPIRMPGLKGFEELERWWYWRSWRKIVIRLARVDQMPQAHDGSRPVRILAVLMIVPVRAYEGHWRSGPRFGRKGATSLGAGSSKQKP